MIEFKKPKFWDLKKPTFLAYLLLPLTIPLIINNFFLRFKENIKNTNKPKTFCIGNIYIGGTAKTPLTIKIYKILDNLDFKTATIKKFYKNHVDEQALLKKHTKLYCFKSRNKALAKATNDQMDIVIFDDGLQDRSINYDLKLVCFNNEKFIGNGFLIPAGPLREKIENIKKYDAIFINGNINDNSNLKLLIKKYNRDITIFETFYEPTNLNEFNTKERYLIFSGIGNPGSFKKTLINSNLNVIKEITFPDHYKYNEHDIENIKLCAKKLKAKIITTGKDYMKIKSMKNNEIQFLKIDINIKNEDKLICYLKKYI